MRGNSPNSAASLKTPPGVYTGTGLTNRPACAGISPSPRRVKNMTREEQIRAAAMQIAVTSLRGLDFKGKNVMPDYLLERAAVFERYIRGEADPQNTP
jgi:hypothetical protein